MGSQQELSTKHPPGRTLRVAEDYFTRYEHGRKRLVVDEQPDVLRHLETIDQTVWRKYQTFLKRSNPLEKAEFYAQQLSNGRYHSIRALAKALKQDFSSIARHLRLLKLPQPIQEYLREHRTPEIVRYFTERRLRDLVKMREARAAWRQFQGMLAQARREAELWSPSVDPSSPASP